jgi:hypothetical protein
MIPGDKLGLEYCECRDEHIQYVGLVFRLQEEAVSKVAEEVARGGKCEN